MKPGSWQGSGNAGTSAASRAVVPAVIGRHTCLCLAAALAVSGSAGLAEPDSLTVESVAPQRAAVGALICVRLSRRLRETELGQLVMLFEDRRAEVRDVDDGRIAVIVPRVDVHEPRITVVLAGRPVAAYRGFVVAAEPPRPRAVQLWGLLLALAAIAVGVLLAWPETGAG